MKRICVFCGSSPGADPSYTNAAEELGRILAEKKITLVFGGGSVGLMGCIARSVTEAGGSVTGVIPKELFDREVAFTGTSDLRVVGSMHERKAIMAELSDGFIAMPGGLGTVEEFFEVLTWAQLGIHRKPCGLLNVKGYYDRLLGFVDYIESQKFIDRGHRRMLLVDNNPLSLLKKFEAYRPPVTDKARWALNFKNNI
jgi:uncharacterized protein (TIGR00730 family)